MRTRLFAVWSSLALAPLPAFAQAAAQPSAPAQQPPQAQPAETQPTDVGQTGTLHIPGAKESVPGEVHTVVKGDTLWDLSEQYLGTPWYWPKVWSYNPQIANPHWIYPGNQIRFYPAGQENAARVSVATPEGTETGEETQAPSDSMEEETGEEGGISLAGKIGYTAPSAVSVEHEGFLTPSQIAEAGTITASPSESMMLSYPDLVYVSFHNRAQAQVGSTYIVFRTVKKISHPKTGDDMGYLTDIIGKVRVVKLGDRVVTAQIVGSSDEIRRGDKIGPANEQTHVTVSPRANTRSLDGYVVTPLTPYLTIVGEESKIIVDKGSADGVEPGNTFDVIRQTDPLNSVLDPNSDEDKSLPVQTIATCMAVTVKEHASTCLLIRSLKEVVPGDRIQMRPGNLQVGMR